MNTCVLVGEKKDNNLKAAERTAELEGAHGLNVIARFWAMVTTDNWLLYCSPADL
jgi:hypothetical protein